MPPNKSRGRGRGRGRAEKEEEDEVTVTGDGAAILAKLREGGEVPLNLYRKAYDLERSGQGKPRTIAGSMNKLKTRADLDEYIEEKIGPDPSDRLLSDSDSEEDDDTPRVGLRNLSLTCYINAILQCLKNDNWFVHEVMKLKSHDEPTKEFQQVLYGLRSPGLKWIDPEKLITKLEVCSSEQQDAHEFYRLLLDYLMSANAHDAGFTKSMKRVFEGGVFYESSCGHCGTSVPRHEATTEITLPLVAEKKNLTLEDCLDEQYNSAIELINDNMYYCDVCKGKQDGKRTAKLGNLPEVMVFALVRFVYDVKKNNRCKRQQTISYPTTLDMTPWVKTQKGSTYTLQSTIHHHGSSAHGGHYVARLHDKDDGWFLYDDTDVTHDTKTKPVASRLSSNDVYILVYTSDSRAPAPDMTVPHECVAEKDSLIASLKSTTEAYKAEYEALATEGNVFLKAQKEVEKILRTSPFRQSDFPDPNMPLPNYSFVSTWWLQTYLEGYFVPASVQSVKVGKQGVDSKNNLRYLSDNTEEEHNVIYRDPCDARNYEHLRCLHSTKGDLRVDPEKVKGVKLLPVAAVQIMSESVVGKGPVQSADNTMCMECVRMKIMGDDDLIRAQSRREEMIFAADHTPAQDGEAYWISMKWWNEWKKKPKANAPSIPEKLLEWDLFQDVRCEHGALSANLNCKKLVSKEVFLHLVEERSMFASKPYLSRSEVKECPVCRKIREQESQDCSAAQEIKKKLKRLLKPLTDAVRQQESLNIIKKDYVRQRGTLFKEWDKATKKKKKEEEKRTREAVKEATKQREQEEAEEAQRKKEELLNLPPLLGGRVQCTICDKSITVKDWNAHKNSTKHLESAMKKGITNIDAAHEDIELVERKNRMPIDVEDDSSSDAKRGKKRLRSDDSYDASKTASKNKGVHADAAENMETEDEEEEDEEEEEEDEYKEPSRFINEEFILVPTSWARQFVSWIHCTSLENPVSKPEPFTNDRFYCKHKKLAYDVRRHIPPATKKEREKMLHPTPDLPFEIIPSDCLQHLQDNDLINEEAPAAYLSIYDANRETIVMEGTPGSCTEGCVDEVLATAKFERQNFVSGSLRLEPATDRKSKKVKPVVLTNIASEDSVYELMLRVFNETEVEISYQELSYNGGVINDDPQAPLSLYGVEDGGTIVLKFLAVPRSLHVPTPGPTSPVIETGFTSSRLQGNRLPAASPPAAPPSSNEWACGVCTFLNSAPPPCSMCGS
eukprot:TRINITY_DN22424_c0_g1_i1.p1 TRINITY_DN22424_c0_g1~~TRINITY_DN22424_c0_g1_i1.p1  ORF type:complete len:1250 (+),score=324.04 TRINITY_DN22424_c0_g1_i1:55-3750(+)